MSLSLNYLQELEITPYIPKSLVKTQIDLLILLEQPATEQLAELFSKLLDSFKLINNKINYQYLFLNSNQEFNTELQKYNFEKLLIFGDHLNLDVLTNLSNREAIDSNNILTACNLQQISLDVNIKKLLWNDLKKFLV